MVCLTGLQSAVSGCTRGDVRRARVRHAPASSSMPWAKSALGRRTAWHGLVTAAAVVVVVSDQLGCTQTPTAVRGQTSPDHQITDHVQPFELH
jgi:hypothetical protein